MHSSLLVRSFALVALALGITTPANAQSAAPFAIDSVAASRGQYVFGNRQCHSCHDLGRRQSTGPDLVGVTDRRSVEWLRRWLKNPVEMAHEDSAAFALKEEFGSQMPNLGLSARDVEGLINYLALVTAQRRTKP